MGIRCKKTCHYSRRGMVKIQYEKETAYHYHLTADADCNLELMEVINGQYTKAPFYWVRRMTAWLSAQGHEINVKRVRKLFRRLRLQAIYPRKSRSFFLSRS